VQDELHARDHYGVADRRPERRRREQLPEVVKADKWTAESQKWQVSLEGDDVAQVGQVDEDQQVRDAGRHERQQNQVAANFAEQRQAPAPRAGRRRGGDRGRGQHALSLSPYGYAAAKACSYSVRIWSPPPDFQSLMICWIWSTGRRPATMSVMAALKVAFSGAPLAPSVGAYSPSVGAITPSRTIRCSSFCISGP